MGWARNQESFRAVLQYTYGLPVPKRLTFHAYPAQQSLLLQAVKVLAVEGFLAL